EPIRHLPGAGGGSMKVRGATTGTPFAARLTALCWGALALLAPVAISACTSSGTSGSTSPTGTPGVASETSTAHPVVTVTQTINTTPTSTVPSGAPVTGGGGTAGFQGTALLVLGAGAILAGAGGLGYRRWLGRRR